MIHLAFWIFGAGGDSISSAWDVISTAGLTGALFYALVGYTLEWWVPGKRYARDTSQLRAERDRALDQLSSATENTQKSLAAAQQALDLALRARAGG